MQNMSPTKALQTQAFPKLRKGRRHGRATQTSSVGNPTSNAAVQCNGAGMEDGYYSLFAPSGYQQIRDVSLDGE